MMVEHTPNTDMKFSLRVKKNLLLFVTALVMCFGYEVRHDGKAPCLDIGKHHIDRPGPGGEHRTESDPGESVHS